MLKAIAQATLNDDDFREDRTTLEFEAKIACLTGHEAAAVVITGTMANQLALRTLLDQPPHAVLADSQSHILNWEAGGVAHLSGAMVQAVQPQNGLYLTVEDIKNTPYVPTAYISAPHA